EPWPTNRAGSGVFGVDIGGIVLGLNRAVKPRRPRLRVSAWKWAPGGAVQRPRSSGGGTQRSAGRELSAGSRAESADQANACTSQSDVPPSALPMRIAASTSLG